MKRALPKNCTAFAGSRLVASGDLAHVAAKVKAEIKNHNNAAILIFDDLTGEPVEIDFRGSIKNALAQFETPAEEKATKRKPAQTPAPVAPGPGRPRLGVIGREITLLPKHWNWLETQSGGASVTLRKLVETTMKANAPLDRFRQAQTALYKFMTAMAGNEPGFEEATRILFAKEPNRLPEFEKAIKEWPTDIRRYVIRLTEEMIKIEKIDHGAFTRRFEK